MPLKRQKQHRQTHISDSQISVALGKALSSLYPRINAIDSYSKRVDDADKSVSDSVKKILSATIWAYRSSIFSFALAYLSAFLLMGTGIYIIIFRDSLSKSATVAVFCMASGIVALMYLLSKTPLATTRSILTSLIKINVVFSGYMRQIHQIDASFKSWLESGETLGESTDKLALILQMIQDAAEETTNTISEILDESSQ